MQKEGIIHEPSYVSTPQQNWPTQLESQLDPSQEFESPNPHFVLIQELESQPPSQNSESSTKVNDIPGLTRPLQVYSRRKAHIPDLLQAQEFESTPKKKR